MRHPPAQAFLTVFKILESVPRFQELALAPGRPLSCSPTMIPGAASIRSRFERAGTKAGATAVSDRPRAPPLPVATEGWNHAHQAAARSL